MKRLFMVCMVILLLILPAGSVFAQDNGVNTAAKSVVRLLVFDDMGEPYSMGSGFAVGDKEPIQYIITNNHVVMDYPFNVYLWRSKDDLVALTVVQQLPVCDLCLLVVANEQMIYNIPPIPLANKDMVSIGQDVYALGFPGADIKDFYSSYTKDITMSKGIISKATKSNDVDVYQTDCPINPGNSGGPLIDKNGYVVGVNTFSMNGANDIYGVVQIDYMRDLLDSRGIAYLKAESMQTAPINTQPPAQNPAPVVKPATSGSLIPGVSNTLLLVGGVVLLIVIILVVVIAMAAGRRKNGSVPMQQITQPVQAPQPVQPITQPVQAPPQQPQRRIMAVVRALSGPLAGREADAGSTVTIGRDARLCQLSYPQNISGISRRHCVVRFDGASGAFVLEDSSTNGTFLASGERLQPGRQYFLHNGDRFYLDDPNNVFEVKMEER